MFAKNDIVSPNGNIYYKANDYITDVTINNDINNIELINELYEIPNTSKNETNYLKTVSNIFMILGIIILYETKKLFNYN